MEHIDLTVPLPDNLQRVADAVAHDITGASGGRPRVGIAYSGGVDSTVLAALTARAIGADRTTLVMAVSASLAKRERRLANRQAAQLGLRLVEVETRELDNPDYAINDVDRCYHCKDETFVRIEEDVVDEYALDAVAYGENLDDAARPDRPGARAAREHRVLHPLATAGATKADVRAIGRAFGIAVADKPAAPCLASRIPHGEPVTAEKLAAIDTAEDAVFAAGFSDCRVRHHGDIARIEIPRAEFALIADDTTRDALLAAVRDAGFKHATIDLAGIQSGAFTLQILSSRPEVA
ncbi:MAG: ATP-dependent sacrificial sulfur transferase LarE [Propionibacterium sp.]|nr:ATP-dependent sacrificial sulfur transferase LarE [Propionibacterium sp.]